MNYTPSQLVIISPKKVIDSFKEDFEKLNNISPTLGWNNLEFIRGQCSGQSLLGRGLLF